MVETELLANYTVFVSLAQIDRQAGCRAVGLSGGRLESIAKPRLSTGSEFFIFNRFPRGHYLVWWVRVRVRVSLGVKVVVA